MLLLQLLVLLRFILFVALFYLALHVILARLISHSENRVLWFFGVITSPLLYPVKVWFGAGAPQARLRLRALVFYGLLWILAAFAARIVADRLS